VWKTTRPSRLRPRVGNPHVQGAYRHAFERGRTGGVGSRGQLRKTRDQVLALGANNPGMQILAAHDPAAAGVLDAARSMTT
jgi:hypothetical protein